jgi:L-malate glycosyltransferase
MNNKINVMHLVLSLETGGLERLVSDCVISMDKNIFNIEVCCFDRLCGFYDVLIDNNIKVTLLKRNQKRYDYFYPLKLAKFLKERNIDILHMHNGTLFHGIQAGILARTSVMILTDHGRPLIESQKGIMIDRLSGYFVDKIIAVSVELENKLTKVIKFSKHKTSTIINGINTNVFSIRIKPKELMAKFGISEKHRVIGTVGRLAEVKDQSSLIDAFYQVHEIIPDSILIIVGDGPLRDQLENKIQRLNLTESVKIIGNRNDVPHILNLFDIFVLPSLSEGTSIALLEAMASGIAPVVTNVGGNPSLVDHNINGIVVPPKKVDELAENIQYLLKNDEKRKEFGERASRKVMEQYSIAKMIKEYEGLYLRLLKEKRKVRTSY